MFKKIFIFTLIVLLLSLFCSVPIAFSQQQQSKEAKQATKIKSQVAKLGIGKDAHIEIKLLNKTELKGYISEIGDNYFVISDEKTNVTTTVKYSEVERIKFIPAVKTLIKKNGVKGFFKKMVIGIVATLGIVLLVCAVSKGCVE